MGITIAAPTVEENASAKQNTDHVCAAAKPERE